MERAQIYREAARRIEQRLEDFSCIAVRHVADPSGTTVYWENPIVLAYAQRFARSTLEFDVCDALGYQFCTVNLEDVRDCRVLALCFMAAIAETEE